MLIKLELKHAIQYTVHLIPCKFILCISKSCTTGVLHLHTNFQFIEWKIQPEVKFNKWHKLLAAERCPQYLRLINKAIIIAFNIKFQTYSLKANLREAHYCIMVNENFVILLDPNLIQETRIDSFSWGKLQ